MARIDGGATHNVMNTPSYQNMRSLEIIEPGERPRTGLFGNWWLSLQTLDSVDVLLFLTVRKRSPVGVPVYGLAIRKCRSKKDTTVAN